MDKCKLQELGTTELTSIPKKMALSNVSMSILYTSNSKMEIL